MTAVVNTVGATRAFLSYIAAGLDSDIGQIELALAVLAGPELDEATLDDFQTVQQDAQRRTNRSAPLIRAR